MPPPTSYSPRRHSSVDRRIPVSPRQRAAPSRHHRREQLKTFEDSLGRMALNHDRDARRSIRGLLTHELCQRRARLWTLLFVAHKGSPPHRRRPPSHGRSLGRVFSRARPEHGCAGDASICFRRARSAHLTRKLLNYFERFCSFSKRLLICGLWVRFPPGSPLSTKHLADFSRRRSARLDASGMRIDACHPAGSRAVLRRVGQPIRGA